MSARARLYCNIAIENRYSRENGLVCQCILWQNSRFTFGLSNERWLLWPLPHIHSMPSFPVQIDQATQHTTAKMTPTQTNRSISITIIQREWIACCVFPQNSHINYFGINLFAFYLVFGLLFSLVFGIFLFLVSLSLLGKCVVHSSLDFLGCTLFVCIGFVFTLYVCKHGDFSMPIFFEFSTSKKKFFFKQIIIIY